jgi:hypothetical protein
MTTTTHRDNSKAGIALIAGSIGGMLTMAVHPTAAGAMTPAQVGHLAIVSSAAHSLALVSVLLLFLGVFGMHRSIGAEDRLSFVALTTYGFACVAVMIAATVSGFILPEIMQRMVRDVPAEARTWQIVIESIFQINQAFSRVFSVGSAVAIFLWSWSGLRSGGLSRGVAIYGCVSAVLTIVAVGSGHLRLNVHGMAAVALAEVIWFVTVGVQLLSSASSQAKVNG